MIAHFQSTLRRTKTRQAMAFATGDAGNSLTPLGIPGCVLWLDAGTIIGVDGSTVSSWQDSSGTSHTMTAMSGTTVKKLNIINGQAVVRFNGSYMATSNVLNNKSSMSAFMVFALRSSPMGILFDQGGSMFSLEHSSGLRPRFYIGNTGGAIGTTDEMTNVFRLHTLRCTGTQIIQSINQVDGTPLSFSGNTSTAALHLGARSGSYYSPADVAEFIVYDNDIRADHRDWLESYLRVKYAI